MSHHCLSVCLSVFVHLMSVAAAAAARVNSTQFTEDYVKSFKGNLDVGCGMCLKVGRR